MRIRGIEALAGGSGAPVAGADKTAALSRRSFLKITGLAGGGLALGIAGVESASRRTTPSPWP